MPDRSLTYSRAGDPPVPSQPAWFHRLDEILTAPRSIESTRLDRLAVQKFFRVRQHRARQIMAGLEGLRVGNAAAVSREALIARSAGQVNFVIGRSWIPPLVTPPHRDCAAHRTPDIFVCFRGRTAAPFAVSPSLSRRATLKTFARSIVPTLSLRELSRNKAACRASERPSTSTLPSVRRDSRRVRARPP